MKRPPFRLLLPLSLLLMVALEASAAQGKVPTSARARQAEARVKPRLEVELAKANLAWGAPIFLRIFKESDELELWLQGADKQYQCFRTYEICAWSGKLGPKLKEGDRQAPEGIYHVTARQLNPTSSYHLSFNLGYPNAYDRHHQRTGSYLMVHGSCVSAGCFAMTDPGIEEIYTLAAAALSHGQESFPVHCFPFRMTNENLLRHRKSEWLNFWLNLREAYDAFETSHLPPKVVTHSGQYQIANQN